MVLVPRTDNNNEVRINKKLKTRVAFAESEQTFTQMSLVIDSVMSKFDDLS